MTNKPEATNEMRAAFEKWYITKRDKVDFTRWGGTELYASNHTQHAWEAWQASRADVGTLPDHRDELLKMALDVLKLIEGKNSTNFKLKAPEYLHVKLENTMERICAHMEGK